MPQMGLRVRVSVLFSYAAPKPLQKSLTTSLNLIYSLAAPPLATLHLGFGSALPLPLSSWMLHTLTIN